MIEVENMSYPLTKTTLALSPSCWTCHYEGIGYTTDCPLNP